MFSHQNLCTCCVQGNKATRKKQKEECYVNIIIIAAAVLTSGGNSNIKTFTSCHFFPAYDL